MFPHIRKGLLGGVYQERRSRESILPVFEIEDGIRLEKIFKIKANKNFELHFGDSDCSFRDRSMGLDIAYYKNFYRRKYRRFKIVEMIRELLKCFYRIKVHVFDYYRHL